MDFWMPKLNGATACRNILAKDPNARVILISGLSQLSEVVESAAVAVLTKPIPIGRLAEVLQTVGNLATPPAKKKLA